MAAAAVASAGIGYMQMQKQQKAAEAAAAQQAAAQKKQLEALEKMANSGPVRDDAAGDTQNLSAMSSAIKRRKAAYMSSQDTRAGGAMQGADAGTGKTKLGA